MRNILLSLIMIALQTVSLVAAPGCMSNTRKLQEKMDLKDVHYVRCTCDCTRYKRQAKQGICTQCGHMHDAQPFEFVVSSIPEKVQVKKAHTTKKALAQLFSYN